MSSAQISWMESRGSVLCLMALVVGFKISSLVSGWREDKAFAAAEEAAAERRGPADAPWRAAVVGADTEEANAVFGIARGPASLQRTHDLCDAVLKLEPEQMPAMLQRAMRLRGSERREITELLLSRWAEVNFSAAAEYAMSTPNTEEMRFWWLTAVTQTGATRDPEKVREWVRALPGGTSRALVIYRLMVTVAETDPRAAMEMMKEWPVKLGESNVVRSIFEPWGRENSEAALEAALLQPPGRGQQAALESVLLGWSGTDPQAALAWLMQEPDDRWRARCEEQLMVRWAAVDPPGALAAVLRQEAGRERDRLLEKMAGHLASAGPETTQVLLVQMPEGSARDKLVETAARMLAYRDVSAGLAWAEGLEGDQAKKAALKPVVEAWAKANAEEAADFALRQGQFSPVVRTAMVSMLVETRLRYGAEEVVVWAQGLANAGERVMVLDALVPQLSHHDPKQALALLPGLPVERQAQHVGQIMIWLGEQDPDGAQAWVMKQAEGEVKVEGARELAEAFAQLDRARLLKWLKGMPAGRSRDAVAMTFATEAAGENPRSATLWAATIANAEERTEALKQATQRWLEDDREAAVKWIKASRLLGEEDKRKLLE